MSITTRDVATIAVEGGSTTLEEFVTSLDLERVPPAVLRVRELRKTLADIEGLLEGRLILEDVVEWIDPETGEEYRVYGAGAWKYPDIEGLRHALRAADVSEKDLARCFRTVTEARTIELNRLQDIYPAVRGVLEDFRIRQPGPKHLTKREERRR